MEDFEITDAREDRRAVPGRNGGTLTPFKPGQSGNPNGAKKGRKHLSTILKELLDQNMQVTINGQPFIMTRAEAIMLEKVRLATSSESDGVRLMAIKDIEDRLEGKAVPALQIPQTEDQEAVVFYIPNRNNRKRLPE